MPNNPESFEDKIMQDIESGKIKLRSKYIFLAEKLGLNSAMVFSLLLAILFFCLLLFYLKSTDNLYYLSFGRRGWYAFLESFPYALVAGLIICLFITGAIIKKSGLLYKKPFTYMTLGLVVLVMGAGAALAKTNVAQFIEEECFGETPSAPVVRFFLHRNLGERDNGLAGRVVEVRDASLRLQTPRSIRTVIFAFPAAVKFDVGIYIVAVGEWRGEVFEAYQVNVIREDELPSVRRSIDRRFSLPETVQSR